LRVGRPTLKKGKDSGAKWYLTINKKRVRVRGGEGRKVNALLGSTSRVKD